MDKTGFLTIYCTYSNLEVVKQTLPSVIEETKRNGNAKLIVHDSTQSEHGQDEKWQYLRELEKSHDFFLLLSTNMSMAHARNMCLHLGQEMYCPDYIAMMEDDYGYHEGLLDVLSKAMAEYYGKLAPNGLRFGLFTGSSADDFTKEEILENTKHSYRPVFSNSPINRVGGTNSSYRCAPTSHWNNVLKGYDTDEYLISTFQTNNLNLRNYHKGFTVLNVNTSELMFTVENEGRGTTAGTKLRLFDINYTASDPRSNYIGKTSTTEVPSSGIKDKVLDLKKRFGF